MPSVACRLLALPIRSQGPSCVRMLDHQVGRMLLCIGNVLQEEFPSALQINAVRVIHTQEAFKLTCSE